MQVQRCINTDNTKRKQKHHHHFIHNRKLKGKTTGVTPDYPIIAEINRLGHEQREGERERRNATAITSKFRSAFIGG